MKRYRYFSEDDDDSDQMEEDFEPRSWAIQEEFDTRRRLPIKTESGEIVKRPVEKRIKKVKTESPELDVKENEDSDELQEETEPDMSEEEWFKLIARFSQAIINNEPNSVKPGTISTLSDGTVKPPEKTSLELLLNICKINKSWKIRKYAILSSLAVFKDVLPQERIRELTEKELQMKATKETRLQRAYEKSLMTAYKTYLSILFDLANTAPWEVSRAHHNKDISTMIINAKLSRALAMKFYLFFHLNL